MPPVDRIDSLRTEIHGVDNRVTRVETELRLHREQATERHDAQMEALAAIRDEARQLRADLSDQGRTPGPPPSLPPTPLPDVPRPALVPEEGRTARPRRDQSSDPGEITLSPRRIAPWLRLLFPYLLAGSAGGAATWAWHEVTGGDGPEVNVSVNPEPVAPPAEAP